MRLISVPPPAEMLDDAVVDNGYSVASVGGGFGGSYNHTPYLPAGTASSRSYYKYTGGSVWIAWNGTNWGLCHLDPASGVFFDITGPTTTTPAGTWSGGAVVTAL